MVISRNVSDQKCWFQVKKGLNKTIKHFNNHFSKSGNVLNG